MQKSRWFKSIDSVDDAVLAAYYSDIRDNQRLTVELERTLFKRYRTCPACKRPYSAGSPDAACVHCGARRDFAARDELVNGTLKFVLQMAREYSRYARGYSADTDLLKTLISAGNLGLLYAIDRFDLKRKTRFLTYAAWWIREKILEELDNTGVIRVPPHRQKAIRAKHRSSEPTSVSSPGLFTLEDIDSIDEHYGDDALEQTLVNSYGASVLQEALFALNMRSRDRYILMTYFGVREDPKNLRQISSRVNLTSERVRQIKADALQRLRDYLEKQRIPASHEIFTG